MSSRTTPFAPLLLLMVLGTAACAPGSNLPLLPDTPRTAYRLGPDDEVRVTVFGDARLSETFRVSDAGTISLPLVGTIPAADRTPAEVRRALEAELRRQQLLTDPSVAVEVRSYRPIYVLGMVERGGQFPYQPGMTALSAVAAAGGFNYRAVRDYVSVTRIGPDGRAREYRAPRSALVQAGDVVSAFERRF